MAWIRTISEQEAEGPLGDLYAKLRQNPHFGMVPNVIKAFSLRPEIAAAVTRLGERGDLRRLASDAACRRR